MQLDPLVAATCDDIAAVCGIVLLCEAVLFNVFGRGLYRILEDVAHRDPLCTEQQRGNGQYAASAAQIQHIVAGLYYLLQSFHNKLCGMVLTCAEG